MRVLWSLDASENLDSITDHIGLLSPRAAAELEDIFTRAAARLVDFPMIGRVGLLEGTREVFPHRRYRMVYVVDGETIRIVGVVHTSRQWPSVDGEGG